MTDEEIELETAPANRVTIKPPKLTCDVIESQTILEELGMGAMSKQDQSNNLGIADGKRTIGLNDLLRLGAFVEGSGVVPLDHGAILMTRQVMLRQMLRLEALAQKMTALSDVMDVTHAIGFLGDRIGKISTIGIRTKVAAEEAAEELRRKKQPSWDTGAGVGTIPIQAQPGSTVHVHTNGVAAAPPPA